MESLNINAVNDLFSIAQSYIDNRNNLVYGSNQTAMDVLTTNEIDCSSFLSLLINGVYYENSRYAGNIENQIENIKEHLPQARLYVNQIAEYAAEYGYAYSAADDYSNLLPGDLVFFSFDYTYADVESGKISYEKFQFHEKAFMKIDHGGVVISQKDDNHLTILHGNDHDVVNSYDVCLFSDRTDAGNDNPYKNAVVLCARFPFQLQNQSALSQGDLLHNGSEKFSGDYYSLGRTTKLAAYELKQDLKPRTTYTMFMTAEFHTTVSHERCYLGLYGATELQSLYPILSWKYITEPEEGKYVLHFITPQNITGNILRVYMLGNAATVPDDSRSGKIEEAVLYEGFHMRY